MNALRIPAMLAAAAGALLNPLLAEDTEPKVIELATGLKGSFSKEVGATCEIVKDELDGVPVLKATVPEGEFEDWKGSVRFQIPNPAPGTYILTFLAKSEPDENYVGLQVWDFSGPQTKDVGPRKSIQLTPEWREYSFDFSIEEQGVEPTLVWSNLARSGRTFYIKDVRLTRN